MKLDRIKSWKNRYREKLIELENFQDIGKVLKDERLQTLFNTPLEELYKQENVNGSNYKYAFGDDPAITAATLGQFLTWVNYEERGFIKFYISESSNIDGLIFYTLDRADYRPGLRPRVRDVCVLSFDLEKLHPSLMRDAYALLLDLRKKYSSVHWTGLKGNRACKKYEEICNRLGGYWHYSEYNPEVIEYSIPGVYNREDLLKENTQKHGFPICEDILYSSLISYYKNRWNSTKDLREMYYNIFSH